jgi:uncharacterized Tic20 family protein
MEAIPVHAAPTGNEKVWALFSHLSVFVSLPFLLPLVVYLAMRGDSRYAADNAREALNFHLSVLIYVICCVPLTFILVGVPLMIAIGVGSLVLAIVAAIRAADGDCYRYPLTIRFIR